MELRGVEPHNPQTPVENLPYRSPALSIKDELISLFSPNNKVKTLTSTTSGLYQLAKLSSYIAKGNAETTIAKRVLETTSGYMDIVDGIEIINDVSEVLNGNFKKDFQEKNHKSLIKRMIGLVGINFPLSLILLNKINLIDLGTISNSLGIGFGTLVRRSVICLSLIKAAEAVPKLRSHDKERVKQAAIKLTKSGVDISLQGFLLAGSSNIPLLTGLGILSSLLGIYRLVYKEDQKTEAERQKSNGLIGKADGLFNVAKVAGSFLEDASYFTVLPFAPPALGEIKTFCDAITLRNIADRWVRFQEEYTGNVLKKGKFIFLTAGNITHFMRGIDTHGINILGDIASRLGTYPLLGFIATLNIKIVGSSFTLVSSVFAIGEIGQKMWVNPRERNIRNYLGISKEMGKVGVITFSGSLGIMEGIMLTPYLLALTTVVNVLSLTKCAYDVYRPS